MGIAFVVNGSFVFLKSFGGRRESLYGISLYMPSESDLPPDINICDQFVNFATYAFAEYPCPCPYNLSVSLLIFYCVRYPTERPVSRGLFKANPGGI